MTAVDVGFDLETEAGAIRGEVDGLPSTGEDEPPLVVGHLPYAMAWLVLKHIDEEPDPSVYGLVRTEIEGQLDDEPLGRHNRALHDSPELILGGRAIKSVFALTASRLERDGAPGALDAMKAYDLKVKVVTEPDPEPDFDDEFSADWL